MEEQCVRHVENSGKVELSELFNSQELEINIKFLLAVFKVAEVDLQFLFILVENVVNLTFYRMIIESWLTDFVIKKNPNIDGILSNPNDTNSLCI